MGLLTLKPVIYAFNVDEVDFFLDRDLAFWRQWARPLSTVVIAGACLAVVLEVMQSNRMTPAPTVPRPAIAMRSGGSEEASGMKVVLGRNRRCLAAALSLAARAVKRLARR